METLSSQVPNDSFYVSAPTSPGRCSPEYLYFHSAPTTPIRKAHNIAVFYHDTEPGTPNTYEDANSTFDEFEFDTSQRFNINKCHVEAGWKSEQDEQKKSQPAMAFADELFCDGKVMPLMPLKPPPRTSPQRSNTLENAGGSPIKRAAKSPIKLNEPKWVLFARRARLVKVDQGNPGKAGPTNPNRETRESTGKRINRFLFRSTSTGKRETEKKQKQDPNSTETKPPEANKLTLTHYRPELFLCVGLGSKYVQQ
ncbi:hypothetical protein SLEP1_g7075 [Rubroshorea leprosula]|uniref:Uncharacterized protein n=1 Tax=Rubroshorea leprosula TaxID=152421 RepID=A0AAV5HXJ5_9ROSI|nr:hypothetical protein SLEP1_g7075 [Rubroshorea leprosula]